MEECYEAREHCVVCACHDCLWCSVLVTAPISGAGVRDHGCSLPQDGQAGLIPIAPPRKAPALFSAGLFFFHLPILRILQYNIGMNMEMNFERAPGPKIEENGYVKYQGMGGILTEEEYANTLAQARDKKAIDAYSLARAKKMAGSVGIELQKGIDPRAALYDVLRMIHILDSQGKHKYRSLLGDVHVFAEVLRILGDKESLDKFLQVHPETFTKVN